MARGGTLQSLSAEEALNVMKMMLNRQLSWQNTTRTVPASGSMPKANMDEPAPLPPSMPTSTSHTFKRAPLCAPRSSPSSQPPKEHSKRLPPAKPATEDPPPTCTVPQRDAVWNQLQADIKAEEAKRKTEKEERRLQQEVQKAEKEDRIAKPWAAALERAMTAVRRAEIERQLEEAQRREAEVRAARERAPPAALKKQQEGEAKRKALQIHLGLCPAGYQ